MPETKTKYAWGRPTHLADGHRLFMADEGFAIADDSGSKPELTDDGVLWLDLSLPLGITLDESFDPPHEHFMIPLVNEAGEQVRTITNVRTLMYLARWLKWPVREEESGRTFYVR